MWTQMMITLCQLNRSASSFFLLTYLHHFLLLPPQPANPPALNQDYIKAWLIRRAYCHRYRLGRRRAHGILKRLTTAHQTNTSIPVPPRPRPRPTPLHISASEQCPCTTTSCIGIYTPLANNPMSLLRRDINSWPYLMILYYQDLHLRLHHLQLTTPIPSRFRSSFSSAHTPVGIRDGRFL